MRDAVACVCNVRQSALRQGCSVSQMIAKCKGRTIKLAQGTSEVAARCMVCCCGRTHRDHGASKSLPLRRAPSPASAQQQEMW